MKSKWNTVYSDLRRRGAPLFLGAMLGACGAMNSSHSDEQAAAREVATAVFGRETRCDDAKAQELGVKTHWHPRWIGRESLRIYQFEMRGCDQERNEQVICTEEQGCYPAPSESASFPETRIGEE